MAPAATRPPWSRPSWAREVTVVDSDGIGGSAVLTDCVPSKTLIATAELMTEVAGAAELGVDFHDDEGDAAPAIAVDLARVNERVMQLAADQSADIARRLDKEGVRGRVAAAAASTVRVGSSSTTRRTTPTRSWSRPVPRRARCPSAQPDGERILTWEQVYDLDEVPSELVVVGSGVTGAEFASAYLALGIPVTLVSSRDRVLPGEDADASAVLEEVSTRRGMNVLSKSRMESVTRSGDVVTVTLTDGRTVEGSHCILALGSVPNTADLGLEEAGVVLKDGGFVNVDRVSRTSARGRVRRRRLHRRADARQRRGDAGPDRDVALPGRRGPPARPQEGVVQRVHRAGDRDRRLVAAGDRRRRDPGRGGDAARCPATPGPRCRASGTAS